MRCGKGFYATGWRAAVLPAVLFVMASGIAQDIDVSLADAPGGAYRVDGQFWTPVAPALAMRVLSDYGHLSDFVPSLSASRIKQTFPDHVVIEQEAVGRALVLFHRHLYVQLDVREYPNRIEFADTSHRDFLAYAGSWKVDPASTGGSRVSYHLGARPRFYLPSFIARKSFHKMVYELLGSVRNEMQRRQQSGARFDFSNT